MKQIFDVDGLPAESFLVVADFADRLPDCVFYFRLTDIGAAAGFAGNDNPVGSGQSLDCGTGRVVFAQVQVDDGI